MKISKIIAIAIKIIAFGVIIRFALEQFNPSEEYKEQTIFFWVLVYIPLFAGYESIFKSIIEILSKDKNERPKH